MSTIPRKMIDRILNRYYGSLGRGNPHNQAPLSFRPCSEVTLDDIETGNYAAVLRKLRNGFNPNVVLRAFHPVTMIVTPLEYAIVCGDWKMMLILILEGGADPDYNAFDGVMLFTERIWGIPAGRQLPLCANLVEPNRGYAGLLSVLQLVSRVRSYPTGSMDTAFPRAKVESAIHLAMFVNQRMGREVSTEKMFSDARRHISVLCVDSNRTENIDDTEWNKSVVKTAKKTLMLLENKVAAHGMPTQVASMVLWEKFWFPNFLVEQAKGFLKEKICAVAPPVDFDDDFFERCVDLGIVIHYDSDESAVDNGNLDYISWYIEDHGRKRRRAR